MKRKTNLFYNAGKDSNFVTFSNYTEALTGNLLATDAKMFPSKFLCLYIPKLNTDTDTGNNGYDSESTEIINSFDENSTSINTFAEAKSEFIVKYLTGYYENKLAYLRDELLNGDANIESNLNPLKYLLDAIKKYDDEMEITFIGDICEQDYNGVFMDNICIIENSAKAVRYKYNGGGFDLNTSKDVEQWQYLYGWNSQSKMPKEYQGITPIYDNYGTIQTNNETEITGIYYYGIDQNTQLLEQNDITENSEIKFNVLIPLFDIRIYDLNGNPVEEQDAHAGFNDENNDTLLRYHPLVLNSADLKNQYDTPLGMWFSDKTIVLDRKPDSSESYSPSWSICISSQFKSFPYSDRYPSNIDSTSNPDKFATISLVMARQAAFLNELTELKGSISNGKYTNVISNNTINTNSIDYITSTDLAYINEQFKEVNDKIDNFNSEIADQMDAAIISYNNFLLSYDIFIEKFDEFSSLNIDGIIDDVNTRIKPLIDGFETKYNDFNSSYDYFIDYISKEKWTTESYSYLSETFGYYAPSYGYFTNAYGYFGESYGYFYGSYGYYSATYSYFSGAFSYYLPSYSYILDAYNGNDASFLPSYYRFCEDYKIFDDFVTSYWTFWDAYTYFESTYIPFYLSYGYFVPRIGYFYPEMGYFNDHIGFFRNSFEYFEPAYQYFEPSYQYFEQNYPIFDDFVTSYWTFFDNYAEFDSKYVLFDDFVTSYWTFFDNYENFSTNFASFNRDYPTFATNWPNLRDFISTFNYNQYGNKLYYFSNNYDNFVNSLNTVNNRIDTFNTNYADFVSHYEVISHYETMQENITSNSNQISVLNNNYDSLNNTVTILQTTVADNDTNIKQLLNERINELVETNNGLLDRIAKLEREVESIKRIINLN